MIYHLIVAIVASGAIANLWIGGGKIAPTVAILAFGYLVAEKTIREQNMISTLESVAKSLREAIRAIDDHQNKCKIEGAAALPPEP